MRGRSIPVTRNIVCSTLFSHVHGFWWTLPCSYLCPSVIKGLVCFTLFKMLSLFDFLKIKYNMTRCICLASFSFFLSFLPSILILNLSLFSSSSSPLYLLFAILWLSWISDLIPALILKSSQLSLYFKNFFYSILLLSVDVLNHLKLSNISSTFFLFVCLLLFIFLLTY